MIITTGYQIDGKEIKEYLDVISVEHTLNTSIYNSVVTKIGAELGSLKGLKTKEANEVGYISTVCKLLINSMKRKAEMIRADGIIGVSFQCFGVTKDIAIILATGTAVRTIHKEYKSCAVESGTEGGFAETTTVSDALRSDNSEVRSRTLSDNVRVTGKNKDKLKQLMDSHVEWINITQAGTQGQELLKLELFVDEVIEAPTEMSEMEARVAGYRNWKNIDGVKRFYKSVRKVPVIGEDELKKLMEE